MSIRQFIEENNIAVFVRADLKTCEFEITEGSAWLGSRDLLEQLILNGSVEALKNSIKDQLMPRIWMQGRTKCFLCQPDENCLVALFLDSDLDPKELYLYAKRLDSLLAQVM